MSAAFIGQQKSNHFIKYCMKVNFCAQAISDTCIQVLNVTMNKRLAGGGADYATMIRKAAELSKESNLILFILNY